MDCERLPMSVRQIATPLPFVVEDGDRVSEVTTLNLFSRDHNLPSAVNSDSGRVTGKVKISVVGSVGGDLTLM